MLCIAEIEQGVSSILDLWEVLLDSMDIGENLTFQLLNSAYIVDETETALVILKCTRARDQC